MPRSSSKNDRRAVLIEAIERLADTAIFGTASETYRTCGNARCRCHGPGPKHGPHMYVSYRGGAGKTTGYYVPKAAHTTITAGIEAWHALQASLRELAELNKKRILEQAKEAHSE